MDEPMFLDASILDMEDIHNALKDDIRQNRIQYYFPAGLNQVDLLEECRALKNLDDFDVMYDLTMQMLEGKPFTIIILNDDGSKTELTNIQVTDRYMDLRGDAIIDQFPILVNWLTEFIGGLISKKYPTPMPNAPQAEGSKKKTKKRQDLEKAQAT